MTASLAEPITQLHRSAARPKLAVVPEATHPFELATVGSRWQFALDAAQRALSSAGGRFGLPAIELEQRRRELAHERQEIGHLLGALARDTGVPAPWLSPVPINPRMLGPTLRSGRASSISTSS